MRLPGPGSVLLLFLIFITLGQTLKFFGCQRRSWFPRSLCNIPIRIFRLFSKLTKWTASSEFGTYSLCEQRRFRAVSPEPSLLAHTSSESRGTFRQKARSLAPLNGWTCAVKICHDGMLEDTNSLDGAQI